MINDDANISIPDDEGNGGLIILQSDRALLSFGFDFADLDTSANSFLRVYDSVTDTEISIEFSDFEDVGNALLYRTDADFGNHHANSIAPFTAADIGLTQFDRVTFDLNSSGGIGSVYGVAVPEPSSALLLALGACLAFVRRKR